VRAQRGRRQSGRRSEAARGQWERRLDPALGDAQARKLLEAPPADTLKGVRDRAILATLLYHGMRREELDRALDPASVYRNIVVKYGLETGVSAQVNGLCVHSLRATAATNALSHEADIAKVQEWLGHANVSTTRLYDRRKTHPEDSPTFRVRY
jgi:site-specific recombinase XerD